MNESHFLPLQPVYLFKILMGLLVMMGFIAAAFELSVLGLNPLVRYMVFAVLFVAAAAIVPFTWRVYNKMDELQKLQHQKACVASLPIIAAAAAVMGILQANDLITGFNQFWMLGLVICVWAFNLMLADRRYR